MTTIDISVPLADRLGALIPFRRSAKRVGEACCVPAEIHFGTIPSGSAGLILQLSRTEVLFRESSQYVLDRTASRVNLTVLSSQLAGTIVSSRAKGYQIRLAVPLDDDFFSALLDEFGVER
jgi:hypothetical protein